jgi:DNA-binding cell septation regulator SpoVG
MKESAIQDEFVSRILLDESRGMDEDMRKVMSQNQFTSRKMLEDRNFKVVDNKLIYTHKPEHRFVDMATRNTKNGKVKKVSHPIHNKILFGRANNVVRRLTIEYTEEIKQLILKDFPKEI